MTTFSCGHPASLPARTHASPSGFVGRIQAYDFKGNLLRQSRQLADDYKRIPDWSADVPLEDDVYTSQTAFDALNRSIAETAPDNSVVRRGYNEAGLLQHIEANLRGANKVTVFVTGIDYNARGQREVIAYGNGARTTYDYDPLMFRLTRLHTTRYGGNDVLQDLSYTYDPAGNITYIRDAAQQTLYFRNRIVDPSNEYTYDAVYRLIAATGREHLGQIAGGGLGPVPTSHDDAPRVNLPHPGDGNAMSRYVQHYVYDHAGNILAMIHRGADASAPGWRRRYAYEEPSQLEPGQMSNRVSRTRVGDGPDEVYAYDAHGNMLQMAHLPLMQWDYKDRLRATSRQVIVNGCTPEMTHYVYAADGLRVRRVTERYAVKRQMPAHTSARIYIGSSFVIHRKYSGDGCTLTFARETLHIMNNQQRIALIASCTKNSGESIATEPLLYQIENNLNCVCIELNKKSTTTTYEEYYPYGSTSYQAVNPERNCAKAYRYNGKEHDLETGLYYYGARYYAAWLGRFISGDPLSIEDGLNIFAYVRNSPTTYRDLHGLLRDKPDDPASSASYTYFRYMEARGPRILTMVEASPTLRLREIERAALSGELTDFTKYPGSSFLGTVGEALLGYGIERGGIGRTIVVPQPSKASLPEWALPAIGDKLPDFFVTQIGLRTKLWDFGIKWNDVAMRGNRIGEKDHGPVTVLSIVETTVSNRFEYIMPRANKVATWARLLPKSQVGQFRAAAVLYLDRGAFLQLSSHERARVVDTVTAAGGYVRLRTNLRDDALKDARSIAETLRTINTK